MSDLPGDARPDARRPAPPAGRRGAAPTGRLLILLAAALLLAPPARGQDEFLVNDDRVLRGQGLPQAALGATGAITVVWTDGRNGPDTFIDYDIYLTTVRDPKAPGARLNRRVNDDTHGALQTAPSIAASPAGTFFCAWEDSRTGNPDIFGVALDSLGAPLGPNLRINDDLGTADQRSPKVAAVGADRYLVVWGDQRSGQSDVFGEWRTAQGAPIDGNVTISVDPVVGGSYQGAPALASNSDGTTLVVWVDGREGGSVFGATFDVYGQLLAPDGSPIGGNFKINDTNGPQKDDTPSVAASPTQGFVVAWIDRRNAPADPGDVYAQRVGPDGSLIGGNVRVNDDPPGRQQHAPCAMGGAGSALVAWEDTRDLVTLDVNVEASRVAYDATPPGPNFQVNTYTAGRQGAPGGTWDGTDSYLVVWEDTRNGPTDIYGVSIKPDGTRNGDDVQLNDDAAQHAQWLPRMGGSVGLYFATWLDDRNSRTDLYGQWLYATGLAAGPNVLLRAQDALSRPVVADATVNGLGKALVAAQVTRASDAGEILGLLLTDPFSVPQSFWISDSLTSAQSMPAVAPQGDGFGAVWIDTRDGTARLYAQELDGQGGRLGGNHPVLLQDPADPVYAVDLAQDGAGGFWLTYAEGTGSDQRLWLAHLNAALSEDEPALAVAPELTGARASPRVDAEPGGRVEVVWTGVGPTGVGRVYHEAFTNAGVAMAPAAPAGDPLDTRAQGGPDVAVLGARSLVAWEGKQAANWDIWLQVFQDGTTPVSGVTRVDEDPGTGDKFDPNVGIDGAGHLLVVWADGRSTSSEFDILGRVFETVPTAVLPDPPPTPGPGASPPRALRAGPARPNPFGSVLSLPVEAPPGAGPVRAYVINVRGQRVRTLLDGAPPAARFTLGWDGTDGRGARVSSGVYWIVVEEGGERRALRVVTLR